MNRREAFEIVGAALLLLAAIANMIGFWILTP